VLVVNRQSLPSRLGTVTSEVKRRMPAPARRERIVAAALEEFAAGGYAATSMGAIAERAGITRAVLYDHFDSKQALYLALLEERNAAFLSHVGARITGSGGPRERMRETIDTVFAFAESEPASWRLLFAGDVSGEGKPARARRQVHAQLVGAVAALLAADAEAAGIEPAAREAMVEMLIAALRGAVEWRAQNPAVERDLLVDAAMELLWRGLGRGQA
jgi:AcrR family transcriptional regulator